MSQADKEFFSRHATSRPRIFFHALEYVLVISLFCLGVTGCVNLPPVGAEKSTREELAAHVKFLAQPALKGRKPGTKGSSLARQYIESRFKACGLVPWGSEKNYELDFGYGKNVVGVLPST